MFLESCKVLGDQSMFYAVREALLHSSIVVNVKGDSYGLLDLRRGHPLDKKV